MKTASAKAKGRNLQNYVVKRLLEWSGDCLNSDDISGRSSGANGEDILLSRNAREFYPISIECKNKKAFAIYKDYEQAKANANIYEPILVVKQNRDKPLAIVDLEFLLDLLHRSFGPNK